MLVGFRGRCAFQIYIKSKPRQYGLKIMCFYDTKMYYLLNAFIYSGKSMEPNPRKLFVSTLNVLSLTNRNITNDNWFTSIELLDKLKKLTLIWVGTMRKNKREIPANTLSNKRYRRFYKICFY